MATLATIFDRLFAARASEQAAPRFIADEDICKLRTFPNEDVYFFVKKIDNTQVVPESDPVAGRTCWRIIASCITAVVLLIAVFLPSLYTLVSGYKIESLRQERQRLEMDRAVLQLDETKLLSPARLEDLAKRQQFIDPAPQTLVYLDEKSGATLARR